MNNIFFITVFNNVHSKPSKRIDTDLSEQDLFSVEEIQPVERVSKHHKEWDTAAYTLCTFQDSESATQQHLDQIIGIVLDFDDGHASFDLVRDIMIEQDIECLIHTTANHTSESPRLRVIIPYEAPLVGQEGIRQHRLVWAYFDDLMGPIDPAGKNPVQKWLFPKYVIEGEALLHEYVQGSHRISAGDLELTKIESNPSKPSVGPNVLASEHPELGVFLDSIDPACSYQDWFETIAASINVFGRTDEVIKLLDEWSQGASDLYDYDVFCKVVESVRDDHPRPAGIGKLRYLAGYPATACVEREKQVTTDDLESIVDSESLAMALELTERSHQRTIDLLNNYDNCPDPAHEKAIWSICEGLAYSALASEPIRVAYPLPTGMGKTTAFRSFARSIVDMGVDIPVAYCAERIEDLADLKADLIDDGVPDRDIGLLHTSFSTHKEIPSIERSEANEYQFLLLAHGRVQHRFSNPDLYLYYKDKERNLVVWDEALITTQGSAINVDILRGEIAKWRKVYESRLSEGRTPKGSSADYKYMDEYLSDVEKLFDLSQWDSELSPPEFDVVSHDYKRALRGVLGRSSTRELEQIIEYSGMNGKIIRAGSNKAFVRYEVVVPDDVKKIVVLDASAEINQLMQYDQTVSLGDIGDVQKDYQNVRILHAPVRSSRDYLSHEFKQSPERNLYLKEMGQIVKHKIPEGEDFIVFTYKDRNDIHYTTQILEYLDELGLGFRERCHIITWGNERGTNRYSHVKYAITLGVVYRDPSEIAASIIGQKRDMAYQVNNTEIKEVSDSLQADILYQGLSRGNMRHVRNGMAGEMQCWVLHKEIGAIEMLKDAIPNVSVISYKPHYLHLHGISDAVLDTSDNIVSYFSNLPESVDSISIKQIVKDLGIENTNTRKWRDAIKRAEAIQYEWYRPKNAQSFYRRQPLTRLNLDINKTLLH